jgi:hypothetical protein
MIFVHLLACSLTNSHNTINVLNGNWEILHSNAPVELVQLEGFGFHFEMEDQIWLWCLFDCVGALKIDQHDITVVTQNAYANIDGFHHVYSHSSDSMVRISNTTMVDVQAVQGDVWIDAPRDGRISSFSFSTNVEVSLEQDEIQNWSVFGSASEIELPHGLMSDSHQGNVMEFHNVKGDIKVVVERNISSL